MVAYGNARRQQEEEERLHGEYESQYSKKKATERVHRREIHKRIYFRITRRGA